MYFKDPNEAGGAQGGGGRCEMMETVRDFILRGAGGGGVKLPAGKKTHSIRQRCPREVKNKRT